MTRNSHKFLSNNSMQGESSMKSKATSRALSALACAMALTVLAPVAAHAQVKPTVTVINPVSSPVNTRITNSVVPVEISNADPIPVQLEAAAIGTPLSRFIGYQASYGRSSSDSDDVYTAAEELQITGVMLQVNARGTAGSCVWHLAASSPEISFLDSLTSVGVSAGRSLSSGFVPLPNLILPAGHSVRFFMGNGTGEVCDATIVLHMTRP